MTMNAQHLLKHSRIPRRPHSDVDPLRPLGLKPGAKILDQLWHRLDVLASRLADDILRTTVPHHQITKPKHQLAGTRIDTPDNELKWLLTSASSLEDVWEFFLRRLKSGSELDLLCFSVLDERGDFIRVRYLYPDVLSNGTETPYEPCVPLLERDNHLVNAYKRRDTTFSPSLTALGPELEAMILSQVSPLEIDHLPNPDMHIFSVPFIAGNQTIAVMTLGFREMDAFSQAKLSYVYTMRDQLAQLVWNLLLSERMKYQAQIDNLTGLLSYSSFQRILEQEIGRAQQTASSVTVMLLDVNNIHEINQQQGHGAGDKAICHVASTMRRLVRGLDTVARYGGDDIVVILPETDAAAAQEIAERFIRGIHQHVPPELQNLSVSVGYAAFPDDTKKKDYVLKLAEQALHLAKFKGAKTGESTQIACHEMDQLNEKTVLEVFASHVAKKYNNIHVASVYQDLVAHIEKKGTQDIKLTKSSTDELMLETITSLAGALDAKDRYTRGHSQAVANYAVALAHALKMTPEAVEEIRLAAFLHDIGKIGIPESILCKQGPLTDKEWEIMKQHPVIGAEQILAPVSMLQPIIPAVLHHHENWDGSGHPHGLQGEEIPLGARIVSIVDAFHALTSDRAYRAALPVLEAKKILESGAGVKWDPHLIDVFFDILTIASPRHMKNHEVSPSNAAIPATGAGDEIPLEPEAMNPNVAVNTMRNTVLNSPLSLKAHADSPVRAGNVIPLRSNS